MTRERVSTRIVGAFFCVLLVSSLAVAPAAASGHAEEEFLVQLDAEGNADVAVTYTYDLETESEQAAFEELRTNETARRELADRFQNRLGSVADDASAATGREMAVTEGSAEIDSVNGVGVVTLTVEWTNLAAVGDDRLTVTEPFTNGFEPDRTFTVEAPDGYGVTAATPEPSSSGGATASWGAGTSLDGFELVLDPSDGGEMDGGTGDGDTDGDGAGLGVSVGVAALAGAALVARRRT